MRIPTCDELQRFNSEVQKMYRHKKLRTAVPQLLKLIPADTVAYWIDHGRTPEQAAREMLAPHGTEQRA